MKDINSLKRDISELAHEAVETGNDVRKDAERKWSKLGVAGARKLKKIEQGIRDKPAQSVGVAFLVGALASLLLGRR